MAEQKETLSSLLKGEPVPQIPSQQADGSRVEKWRRDLIEYIRRLAGKFTGDNILQTIIQTIGNTIQIPVVVAWRYDTTSHKFQIKTKTVTVLASSAASAWTDNPDGSQPTSTTEVNSVHWNTTSGILYQDYTSAVYALEKGSATTNDVVDTAVACS